MEVGLVTRAGPRRLRKDANHSDVVSWFEHCRCLVWDAAAHGAPFDLLVRTPSGRIVVVEVKHGKGKLTDNERDMIADGWPVRIVRDVDDVVAIVGEVKA